MDNESRAILLKDSRENTLAGPHAQYLVSLARQGYNPAVIYDIGSSLLYWCSEAQRIWPGAIVICFDGMEELDFLYESTPFQFLPAILSDSAKVVKWDQNDRLPGGNSYFREKKGHTFPENRYRECTTVTLDEVVQQKHLPYPDLIKLDVQGAESDVLRGATKCLEHCTRLIVEIQREEYNEGAPLLGQTLPFVESLGFYCEAPLFCDNGPDGDYGFARKPN